MIKIKKIICYHCEDNIDKFNTFNVIDELYFRLKDFDGYSFTILDDDKEIAIVDVVQYDGDKNTMILEKEENSNLYLLTINYDSKNSINKNIKNKIYYFQEDGPLKLNDEYYIMPYVELNNECYTLNNEVVGIYKILILKKIKVD